MRIAIFNTFLAILMSAVFSSLSFAVELSEVNSFRLASVDVHLIQDKSTARYFTDTKIAFAVQKTMERFLPFSSEQGGSTLDLDVFIHINLSSRQDYISYIIHGREGGVLVLDYTSQKLNAPFNNKCATLDDYEKVYCNVPGVIAGRHIVQVLSDLTSNFDYGKDVSDEEMLEFQKQLIESTNQAFVYSRDSYIPDSVTTELIENINHKSGGERIDNYQRITTGWVYTPALQVAITNKIDELIESVAAGGNTKELRYAMNALASFGETESLETFKKIQTMPNIPSELVKELRDSMTIFHDRKLLVKRVLSSTDYNNAETWEVNQLHNRLNLPTNVELISAMKEVFEYHIDNKFLLNKVASILEQDLRHKSWRDEVDAWACKTIERSGDKSYLTLVQNVESKAKSEKIQDYAESARKRLAKLK